MLAQNDDLWKLEAGHNHAEHLSEKPGHKRSGSWTDGARTLAARIGRLRPWSSRSTSPTSKRQSIQLHRTSYLDGLRGVAALVVFIAHNEGWGHSSSLGEWATLEGAWAWNQGYHLICFPILRNLFSGGHLAVAVFFVISGYVLSAKPLSLIHNHEPAKLLQSLGSAIFRRWFRLFVPVFATTFIFMTTWHIFHIRSSSPLGLVPLPTFAAEIRRWYKDNAGYSYWLVDKPWNSYNDHAWSIMVEFRGSILIYTSLLAFASFSKQKRLLCELGLILYFTCIVDGWACALFATGLLICDLDLLAARDELPPMLQRMKAERHWVYWAVLMIGLYVGGVESRSDDLPELRKTLGWHYLSYLPMGAFTDFRWFFRYWSATSIIVAAVNLPRFRAIFETRVCQFLGHVSFGLYLVHGPILATLGDRFYAAAGRLSSGNAKHVQGWIYAFILPATGPYGLEINFLAPLALNLAVCLGSAWLFTKYIDEPSIKLGRWLFETDFRTEEEEEAKSLMNQIRPHD